VTFTLRQLLYWTLLAALIATVLGYEVRERSRPAPVFVTKLGYISQPETAPYIYGGGKRP
jgi:hypothetical protein